MQELAPLIKDLAIMLGAASVVTLLFQKIRQPVVLGYIVAGFLIGPYMPPYSLIQDMPNIKILSELGIIFLMFFLGLDFSFHKLKRIGFSAGLAGFVEIFLMLGLGFILGHLIGWSFYNCLFLGAALAISSTTIIVKTLEDLSLKGKRFADLIFGILIVEDLLAILLLAALSTVVITKNIFSLEMVWASVRLVLVVGSWFLLGYFLIPNLFRRIVRYAGQETITIVSITLCLLLVTAAAYFHYSTALGAFIMGSILAETPLAHRIKQLIRPVRDIFAAVFFISVGMMINPKLILAYWPIVLLVSAVKIIGKIFITGSSVFLTGQSLKTSVRVGFGMAPVGEFSFIIIGLGLALNVTSNALFQVIVGTSVVTTLATPYLIKSSMYLGNKIDTSLSDRAKYFLESYSAWIYRTLISSGKQQQAYRKAIGQLFINGIIVAIIFTLTSNLLLPEMIKILGQANFAEITSWIAALLLSSPFIWGMLFSCRAIPVTGKKGKVSLVSPLFLGWFATGVEIFILSFTYFYTWLVAIVLGVGAILFFGLSYKQLEKSYHWFEKQLVGNLRKKSRKQVRYEELAPWDTHLVEIVVTGDSPFISKTLHKCQLREKFGINIVAINRGSHDILAPRGAEKILPYDRLLVLGNDEQIDAFKEVVEKTNHAAIDTDLLANFVLKSFVLEKGHPYIGKSIRDSKIREQTGGIVVGLERKGFRILNPDPVSPFKAKDLLLIVGEEERLKAFNTAT